MSVERRGSLDRRSGKDRRQEEKGPPTNFERRRAIEARQPELTEPPISEDELKALGFPPNPSGNARKTGKASSLPPAQAFVPPKSHHTSQAERGVPTSQRRRSAC